MKHPGVGQVVVVQGKRKGIIYLTSQEFLDLTSSQSKLDRPELIMK